MAKTLKLTDNERVELSDFQFAVDEGLYDVARQPASSLLSGNVPGFVLDGFEMSNPSGKQLRVTRSATGRALLSYRDREVVKRGAVINDGDQTLTIDLASYPQATFQVFIRAERSASDTANRILWNPTATIERSAALPTRITERWAIRVETTSPGTEWLQIGTVVVGVSNLTITDRRPFFFEGNPANSYDPVNEWGNGANDRNANRALHGVKDLRTAIRALQTQLEYVMDGAAAATPWYALPPSNEGLTQKLGKFGGIGVGTYDFTGLINVNGRWTFTNAYTEAGLTYYGTKSSPYDIDLALAGSVPLTLWNTNTTLSADGSGGAHMTTVMRVGHPFDPMGVVFDLYGRTFNSPVFRIQSDINDVRQNMMLFDAASGKIESNLGLWPVTNGPSGQNLGDPTRYWSSNYFDTVHAKQATVYNTQVAPGSMAELARLNQRAMVMAWGKISVTQVIDTDHYNVNTGTNVAGVATITLDVAVSDDSIVLVNYNQGGNDSRPPQATIINLGTQLQILTYNNAGAATNRGVSYCVIGHPRTFATAP